MCPIFRSSYGNDILGPRWQNSAVTFRNENTKIKKQPFSSINSIVSWDDPFIEHHWNKEMAISLYYNLHWKEHWRQIFSIKMINEHAYAVYAHKVYILIDFYFSTSSA